MNKLTIPTILAATVLVAGIFAFMPVEQATTVHTSGTTTIATNGIGIGDFAAGSITTGAIAADFATEIADAVDADVDFTIGSIDANGVGIGDFATNSITVAAVADTSEPFSLSVSTVDETTFGSPPTCTSNKPFILEIDTFGPTGTTLTINDGANNFVYDNLTGALNKHITLAGDTNQIWTLTGSADTVDVLMTIRTQQGAVAECNAG